MRKRGPSSKTPLEFIYGPEPEELGGDGETFVLAEKKAALVAVQAWQARTWGEFAQAANSSLESLLEGWGDEIEELCGKAPTANDTFSSGAYCGATYFSDIITDPRQAAFDAVTRSPVLRKDFEAAGFEFQSGFPGFPGVEAIYFSDELKAEHLRLAGVIILRDDTLLHASLPN